MRSRERMREMGEPRAARAEVFPGTRERWATSVDARGLVLVSATLLAFGLAVLYSASSIEAARTQQAPSAFLVRQITGALVGIVAFMIVAKIDAERWRAWAWPLMGISLALMLAVLFAPPVNNSRRFLLGGSIQPSEIAKLAIVAWTAMLVVKKGPSLRRLTKGLLPFLLVIGLLDALAVLEPDLSVAMMYTLISGIVLFAGGVRVGHFVLLGILAIPVLWTEMERVGYAAARMFSFLGLGDTPASMTYQLTQSLIAVGSGGFWGKGFGEGRQQLGFVPLQYNDFIASNVGEELGFLGIAFLVIAFGLYGWIGFRIARAARTPFQKLLAIGLTVTIVITAYLHIGVVIGLLPTTGLTLPFVSYGRSNLVLTCLMTGILVNIASRRERVADSSSRELTLASP